MTRRLLPALAAALPALLLEAAARLGAAPPPVDTLARLAFLAGALALGWLGRPARVAPGRWRLPWAAAAALAGGALAAAAYAATGAALAAWALALAAWAAALWLADILCDGAPWPLAAAAVACCAGLVGGSAVALEQLEGGFADEEFFSAVAAAVLAAGWALAYLAHRALAAGGGAAPRGPLLPLRRRWLAPAVALLAAGGGLGTLRAYQASFLPAAPPPLAGVSADAPFRCEQIAPPAAAYDGAAVFAAILGRVEAHPLKGPPEYGMLALGTGERAWAEQFRAALLAEAAAASFSGPANSVKYGQYEAAKRAYYYSRVRAAFPELFGPDDDAALRAWFAAINRRALTVEWVDLLYGAAFGYRTEGPYVNQESGAGLLSVLEATGLADPTLSERNRAYLARAERGWRARWRNSDDTYYYQSEWITNALYQSLAGDPPPAEQVRRSLDWLRLQATPDGSPVAYNFPYPLSADAVLYLGAELLGDPRYLWAAGRAATSDARAIAHTGAQPGVDRPIDLPAEPPTEGSCLLYGDTGTPIARGPLGPDKIVFREGWEPDDAYMLLNLRFSGWHRYKATNTLSLVYQGAPLVRDQLEGRSFSWLPRGRSAFRDKRIPRENLSGLAVGRSGVSAVRHTLAAIDGPWAQDPPPFAGVKRFEAGAGCDVSVTTIAGWHGWDQRRTISFCPGGVTVVADEAAGPAGAPAAVMWNLAAAAPLDGGRARLGGGAELVVLPLDGAVVRGERPAEGGFERVAAAGAGPRLRVVTVLLTGGRAGAEVTLEDGADPRLRVSGGGEAVELAPFAP